MPTQTLRPTSAVGTGSWLFSAGAFVANISDASDGTRVYNTDGDDEFVIEYTNLVLPASIVSVTSSFRHDRSGGGIEIAQFVKHPGGAYTYGAWIAPGASVAQTDEVLARPGGGTWTRADINALQGGCVSRTGDPGEEGYVYDLWLSVLTRGGGSAFADLLSLIVGPTIPAMAWQSFVAIRRELAARGVTILPDEARTAFEALRCDPRPRYFFA